MQNSGVIYHSSWKSAGSFRLDLPQPPRRYVARYYFRQYRKPVASPLKILSSIALLVAGAGILLTLLPVAALEVRYRLDQQFSTIYDPRSTIQLPIQSGFNFDPIPTPEPWPTNEQEAFSIRIPKIDAQSIVIPNVDAGKPALYMPALKQGVAHALGTGFPGVTSTINRTIYLFAHSTSAPEFVKLYNAQFYLLHKLEAGDEIEVTFWTKPYRYRVTETKIVEPGDTSFLQPQVEKELLVLATCWPPGTTSKRLLVLAERV